MKFYWEYKTIVEYCDDIDAKTNLLTLAGWEVVETAPVSQNTICRVLRKQVKRV